MFIVVRGLVDARHNALDSAEALRVRALDAMAITPKATYTPASNRADSRSKKSVPSTLSVFGTDFVSLEPNVEWLS